MEKSHVSMEQKICPVTGKKFEVGILMDKRLKPTLERYTLTGFEFSPEVKEILGKGYVAIVEIDESRSHKRPNGRYNPEDVYRLGGVAYMKREKAKHYFGVEDLPEMIYTDKDVFSNLEKLFNQIENSDANRHNAGAS